MSTTRTATSVSCDRRRNAARSRGNLGAGDAGGFGACSLTIDATKTAFTFCQPLWSGGSDEAT